MTIQEKKWFLELTKKRSNAVDVLEEEGLLNVFVSHIVDTYRESAHFIYELLQNADDVGATKVRFRLGRDGILFAHNGKISFSISDPKLERKESVKPGHINAITTFSLSTKKEDIENKIGKFGIGFKSVFQYTDTPHVYNYPYCFRIEKFMIPLAIEHNASLTRPGETTAFWLPFNKENKEEAYLEISQKLKTLWNPLLFLRNLETVKIKIEGYEQTFSKKIKSEKKTVNDIVVQEISLNKDHILKFERKVNISDATGLTHSLPISIGFIIEDGKISCDEKHFHYLQFAWCFFPTKQETKLNYIVNAPFILTPNREALKEKRIENNQLVEQIGHLFDIAIQELKSLGYITEEFFTTLPIPRNIPVEFRPIGDKIVQKLKSGEFIPTREGDFVSVSNAYVCSESLLNDLLKYDNYLPLHNLTRNPKARLVFPERRLFADQNLYVFFYQNFCAVTVDLNSTWFGRQYDTSLLEGMPEEFDIKFFKYLIERSNSILAKGQPLWNKDFVPVENGEGGFELVKPLADDGSPQIFIDGAKFPGRYVVVDYLSKDLDIHRFLLNTLNARIPNDFDDFCASLAKYEEGNVPFKDVVADFHKASEYFNALTPNNVQKLTKVLKSINFVIVTKDNLNYSLTSPSKWLTYFPKGDLKEYFKNSEIDFNWFASKKYFANDSQADNYKPFLQELHIQYLPYHWDNNKGKRNVLHHVEDYLQDISLEGSIYLMNVLIARNVDFNYSLSVLKTTEWLYDSEGNKKEPNEIFIGKLHSKYPSNATNIHLKLGGQTESIINKYVGLTDKEKQILETISVNADDLSIDEIKEAIAEAITKKQLSKLTKKKEKATEKNEGAIGENAGNTSPDDVLDDWTKEPLERNRRKINQEIIDNGIIPTIPNSVDFWREESDEDYFDNPGGLVSKTVVGTHYRETTQNKKKKQFEKEIEVEAKRNRLIELAGQFEPYSFGWFKTLLELEDSFITED
ncbi:MAG: sacsin N-terminal ATP-binding-like domain-containing protein, partial [Flavisolibacter sp.]